MILKDPQAVMAFFTRKASSEKAKILAYCAVRLNLCRAPITPDIERTVIASARSHAMRHSSFESEKAMLDLRKFEAEMQFLSRVIGQTKGVKGPDLSLNKLMPNMGTKVFSGF